MRSLLTIFATAGVLTTGGSVDSLRPDTLAAFNRYVQMTEARIQREISGASPFLWIDRQPPAERSKLGARLERGEIISARLETRDRNASIDARGALIHHWVGTIFLPGARLEQVRAVVQNYDQYPRWFGPLIQRAKVTSRSGQQFQVAMRTQMRKVLTVTVDADYAITYQSVSPTTLHVRSLASNIHLVDSPCAQNEQRTPAEQTFGFLWRLNTYCSFSETRAGTYEQCESVSLTRDIPFGFGTIVRPLVSGIPRETIEFTLSKVREQLR